MPATTILLHRIRPQLCRLHRRNDLFKTQKRFPHSQQLVQDPRNAQRKQLSLSLLWISPSLDPPLPLRCCKTYKLLVPSPSPPLLIQIVVTVEAPQILPSTCLVVQQEISDIPEGDQTTLQVPLRKPFQIVAIHLESRVLLLTNNEDLKYAVSVSSEQDLGQAKLCSQTKTKRYC